LKKKKPDIFIRSAALKRIFIQKTINQQITASKNNVFEAVGVVAALRPVGVYNCMSVSFTDI
jgi:hypothetical protein